MGIDAYFGSTYEESRAKFLDAAGVAQAQVSSYRHQAQRGPNDTELFVDVAEIGAGEQPNLLLIISGTHGVEGFCGSGCQVGFLVDRIYKGLPKTVGVALIHALNPYGFAWLRRVNEENVDLNRNFLNFSEPLPSSAAYEKVHEWLVPSDWDGPSRQRADSEIQKFLQAHNVAAFQDAVSRGQYSRPDGLFFGGTDEAWSNRTLKTIIAKLLAKNVKHLAVLDLHTGLGPMGYGEPIYMGADLEEYLRVLKWFGPEVTCTAKGDSTSAFILGTVADGIHSAAKNIKCTIIALEFGTVPIMQVLAALRADNWLYVHRKQQCSLSGAIKKQMRDAFYIDEPWWRAAVYGRSVDMILRAARNMGLHQA